MRRISVSCTVLLLVGVGCGSDSARESASGVATGRTAAVAPGSAATPATSTTATTASTPAVSHAGTPSASGVPGRWREVEATDSTTTALAEQIEALESLGYSSGQSPARELVSVTRLDESRVEPGWNLYTSGHGPEAILMDMHGVERHRWRRDYQEIWPGRKKNQIGKEYWRRARLLPDGDLLVLFEGQGVVRLAADSSVRWARHQRAHHDVTLLANGEIWILERTARMIPEVDPDRATLEDLVTMLRADGSVIRTVSLLECLENSPECDWRAASRRFLASQAMRLLNAKKGDIFHTNSIRALRNDEGPGPLGEGRALFSFRHLDMLAVVNLNARKVTWWNVGQTSAQHDAQITASGTVTAFDNLWAPGRSRVVEIDPESGDIVWEYGSDDTHTPFVSRECGSVRVLPNGNALVTEADQGRAFEVTRGGERVWEFTNPHRAGEGDRYVASIFGLDRIPVAAAESWLREPALIESE